MGIRLSRGVPGTARFLVASARCGGFCYNPRGLGPPEPPHIPTLFFPIWPLNWEVLNGLLWDARTSEQEGIGGSLCPNPSRGWARHCQPSTLPSLPAAWAQASSRAACTSTWPLFCAPIPRRRLSDTVPALQLFSEEFSIPFLCPPQGVGGGEADEQTPGVWAGLGGGRVGVEKGPRPGPPDRCLGPLQPAG